MQRTPVLVLCGLIGLFGSVVLAFSMPRGITPSYDSAVYFSMSREVLSGHGLSAWTPQGDIQPVTHFTPLLPLALAGVGTFGVDPSAAAFALNAILFGVTLFLTSALIGSYTRSVLLASFCGLLMLTALPLLRVYIMAWTEPYFIVLLILGHAFLTHVVSTPQRRYPMLIGAGLSFGFAILSRYAGLALLGVIPCVFLLLDSGTLRRRVVDSILCGALAAAPIGLWFLRNLVAAHHATDRLLSLELVTLDNLRRGVWTASAWVLVDETPTVVKLIVLTIVLIALVGATGLAIRARHERLKDLSTRTADAHPVEAAPPQWLARFSSVLLIFIVVYPAFLLVSISLLDHATPLDYRILSPLFVIVVLYTICTLYDSATLLPRAFRRAITVIAVVVLGGYIVRGVQWTADLRVNGTSFSAPDWQNSTIMAALKALPASTTIYTNGNEAVYLFTGRLSIDLPQIYSPLSQAYLNNIDKFRTRIEATNCVVVFFDHPDFGYKQALYLPQTLWEQHLALKPLLHDATGTLYSLSPEAFF